DHGLLTAPIDYPGRAVDPDLQSTPFHPELPFRFMDDGRIYGAYNLWFPVTARLAMDVFGLRGLIALPALAGAISVLFAGLIVERWATGRGWIAVLLAAFATPAFFYSEILWEHTVAL